MFWMTLLRAAGALALATVLLAATLLPLTIATPRAVAVTPHCGDASGDGIVTSIDAAIVLQFIAGLAQLQVPEAQVDPDGNFRVDTIDVLLILQADAHRIHTTSFNCPM